MRIPQIKFGDDFYERSDAEKIAYLKQLASTMNHAADLMQKERNTLAAEVERQTSITKNAEYALTIQKGVVMNQLMSGNKQIQELSAQIQELQKQLKAANQTIEDLRR